MFWGILLLALIFLIPFGMVIEHGGNGVAAFVVASLVLIAFIVIINALINCSEEKKEEKQRYEREAIEEYEYNDFIIKKRRTGEYEVEYHGEPVKINPHLRGNYPLNKGFIYGKKISIEEVYKNLDFAKKYGFYC